VTSRAALLEAMGRGGFRELTVQSV
jgi:hypothetical protein